MIAPALRSSAALRLAAPARLATAASSSSSSSIASSSSRRTLLTKAERWSHEDMQTAIESPDLHSRIQLSQVAPNIEARWNSMSKVEQYAVYRQLEEMQRKDWKDLSLDEKKAAYFVSFGPHGPRKPITQPGQGLRTLIATGGLVGLTFAIFYTMRTFAAPAPKTMTKEYQEQMTEKAREENLNPISGISSQNYKGKGYVQGN
ncbi:unnamed protein product [Jaminaea pallidilutea]